MSEPFQERHGNLRPPWQRFVPWLIVPILIGGGWLLWQQGVICKVMPAGISDSICPGGASGLPQVIPYCGDGQRDFPNEQCDGNDLTGCISGQTCTDSCTCVWEVEAEFCGNGQREGVEMCDGSDLTGCLSGQSCTDSCTCVWKVEAGFCGNGQREGTEMCDGGDLTGCAAGQSCSDMCTCITIEIMPLPTVTPTPWTGQGPPPINPPPSTCGNGVCEVNGENSDLCPQDCQCVDDGVCAPGEGSTCLDCGENAGMCGAPCSDSSQCAPGLACADGVCWEAGQCGGDDGGSNDGNGTCACEYTCIREGLDASGAPQCREWGYRDCKGNVCRP